MTARRPLDQVREVGATRLVSELAMLRAIRGIILSQLGH